MELPKLPAKTSDPLISDIKGALQEFFKHKIIVKMFHFQTERYGWHKASDEYLEKFCGNFDQLMEIYQGIYGQFKFNKLDMGSITLDTDIKMTVLGSFEKTLNMLNLIKKYNRNEINAVVDVMMADIQQFKYLLMFV